MSVGEPYSAREAELLALLRNTTAIAEEARQEAARFLQLLPGDTDAGACTSAASCYLVFSDSTPPKEWPFAASLWEPTTTRADFIKAVALYLLAVGSIDRETGW
jgi:hypothetical protein